MSARDDAARKVAEAVRERYLQPNDHLVIPHWMSKDARRMWEAMREYETVRRQAEPDADIVMTYQLEVATTAGRGIYDTVQVRRNQPVPDPEQQARALIGQQVRDTPLGRTENLLPPDARIRQVTVHTWVGPFAQGDSMLLRSRAIRTARAATSR